MPQNHRWGSSQPLEPMLSSHGAQTEQPIAYAVSSTHSHIHSTVTQKIQHSCPIPLRVVLTSWSWLDFPSALVEQGWQNNRGVSRGQNQTDRLTDRQASCIVLPLGSNVNCSSGEPGIFFQISEGTWEISRGHLPIGIWKGPGSILEGTQPATKEVNTSVFLAAQDVIQWHTNTEMTPKIWGQIYLHRPTLLGIIAKISGSDLLWSRAYMG